MIYVCSDIHGHYDKFLAMLKAIQFRLSDTLWIVGDIVDRGPEGCRILLDIMDRPNIFTIIGNHELYVSVCLPWLMEKVTDQSIESLDEDQLTTLSEWIANGGGTTLRELRRLPRQTREQILEYIREMDLYAQISAGGRDYVLVHAGLEHFSPDRPLEEYELSDFLFSRPGPDRIYYADRYLVYGHTPTRLMRKQMGEPPSDRILRRGKQIAIDCGCGFGGALGCLCLDTLEEFYVE